jgi:hypothetical protein
MVLALPILLMIMALMINFGTVAAWKVRGLAMSRHAAWSTRPPRNGLRMPRPDYWPPGATASRGGGHDLHVLDDPRVDQPVARGPLPYGAIVNERLLDPTRGLRRGRAEMTRAFPMLGELGPYRLRSVDVLLDDAWDCRRMGLWNTWRLRVPVIYQLATVGPGYVAAYVQAVRGLLDPALRQALRPLDRDDEFIGYSMRFEWGRGAPDFHPRMHSFCTLSHETAGDRAQNTIDRIQGNDDEDIRGVPERMTSAFINLYENVIDELQDRMSAQPPPPPGEMAAMQAEIAELEDKIDTLRQYLATITNDD